MSDRSDLVVEMLVPAPASRVFDAWRSADALTRWLAPLANVRLEEGGPFELFWDPENRTVNSTIGCRVLGVEPNARLVFSWKGPLEFAMLMNDEPLTRVTVDFIPQGDATLVRLTHRGWRDGPLWEAARSWHERAWNVALQGLRAWMEQGPSAKPYWEA